MSRADFRQIRPLIIFLITLHMLYLGVSKECLAQDSLKYEADLLIDDLMDSLIIDRDTSRWSIRALARFRPDSGPGQR